VAVGRHLDRAGLMKLLHAGNGANIVASQTAHWSLGYHRGDPVLQKIDLQRKAA
jgi:hypothetical protein